MKKLIDNENNDSDDGLYNVTDADSDDSINKKGMHTTIHVRGGQIKSNNSNEDHLLDKQEIKKLIREGLEKSGKQNANMTSVKVE